jgi:GT2 family glycosyltransferase
MTPPRIASVAVIVVNYGTPELALAAVQSVLDRGHGGRAVEVHLVDNASPGGDAATFRREAAARGWGDRVALHLEEVNHGFGRGNNVVLEALRARSDPPDAAFLLNPDARLENEAVDLLARALEADPRAGFAGAGIALPDGRQVTAAFRFPSLPAEFAQAMGFGPVSRALAHKGIALPPDHPGGAVDWVAGAAVMVRLDALRETGLFDPDFFLYFEEVELMWRGARAGWRCLYVPAARVVHAEGAATDVRSSRAVPKRHPPYRYDAWRLYHLKTAGRRGAAAVAAATLAGAACGAVLARLRGRRAGVPHFLGDFWRHAARPILLGRGGRRG